jgi:expansin (peptidoglycan-binding protein)
VRLTSYQASSGGYCEFDRTLPVLPAFVREGLTTAVGEPWDGSSYGGQPGEACGECYEIATVAATRTVMVHDLCPIEGNPVCAGSHFHLDLASEAAQALGENGIEEAALRRVPCPVTGNVYLQINDRNEWGYVRFAFINHRVPIRAAEFRSAAGGEWKPVARSGGAWNVVDGGEPFASKGPGGVLRITSATGEVVEAKSTLTYGTTKGSTFDLGVQLAGEPDAGISACVFTPPAVVYDDAYGGIDRVRWRINPWSGVSASEARDGCFSGSCVRIDTLAQWSGLHFYYVQGFPSSTFRSLSFRARALSGEGKLNVTFYGQGASCAKTEWTASTEWTETQVDIATACTGAFSVEGITIDNPGDPKTLLLDDIRFSN